MIFNERQRRVTARQVARFRKAIEKFDSNSVLAELDPGLVKAEREGMESVLADLEAELDDYDRLKSTDASLIAINSFEELGEGLIKARIANGLSQKKLAARIGLKKNQIQRYEAERYASASYETLRKVADALGIQIGKDVLVPIAPKSFGGLIDKLNLIGIERDFFLERLLTSEDADRARSEVRGENDDFALASRSIAILKRIFGWGHEDIFGDNPLVAPCFAAAEARFKMPARHTLGPARLYAAYANYLAVVAIQGARSLPMEEIPAEATGMRNFILSRHDAVDLRSALHTAWDLGVVVLPLQDPGVFHGACWRYEWRNVIVLKQKSKHQTRWIFDLLHELYHASQRPNTKNLEAIEDEETSTERRNPEEEIAASRFAGDVMLAGEAESLAEECVLKARGSIPRLKNVVPAIAAKHNVGVGALANFLAFQLSRKGENWWGSAANLQSNDIDPWSIARDVFIERFPFEIDNELDRKLLDRALQ